MTKWLQQVTDFFMGNAGIKDFTPASRYFDPSLYFEDHHVTAVARPVARCSNDRPATQSVAAPMLVASVWPTDGVSLAD